MDDENPAGLFEYVIRELDVLYVTRIQRERFPDLASYFNVASSYRVTPELLLGTKEHMIVLHPLPRVDEIDRQRPMEAHAATLKFDIAPVGIVVSAVAVIGQGADADKSWRDRDIEQAITLPAQQQRLAEHCGHGC